LALEPVVMERKRILFRNFAGLEGQYNAEGKRNFNVLLEEEEARLMEADGWNVKYLEPREEGDIRQARLEVSLTFKGRRPPRIILITSRGKTPLGEAEVQLLDWADIISTDLIIRAYEWGPINGKTGVKAYMNAGYFTIREDALELKYADTPDAPDSAAASITRDAVQDEPEPAPF
jgi:hypothetical protein